MEKEEPGPLQVQEYDIPEFQKRFEQREFSAVDHCNDYLHRIADINRITDRKS